MHEEDKNITKSEKDLIIRQYKAEIELDIKIGKIKRNKQGKYCKRKILGRDSQTGKKINISGYGETALECAIRLAECYENYFEQNTASKNQKTFRTAAEEWYEACIVHGGQCEKNKRTYRINLDNHIIKYFGDSMLNSLNLNEYQKFLNMYEGKGESHVKKLRMTLNQILNFAEMNGYIKLPRSFILKLPMVKKNSEKDKLSDDEFKLFLKARDSHKCFAMFITMYCCGLRPSEALRLNWDDIDLNKKYLIVRVSKTENGENRVVPIADLAIEYLTKEKQKFLDAHLPLKHVFGQQTDISVRQTQESLGDGFKSYIRQMNIIVGAKVFRNKIIEPVITRNLTPDYMRHSFCSNLFLCGVSDYIPKRLMGHSLKGSVTTGVYTHFTNKEILTAAKPYIGFINEKIKEAM